MDFITNYEKKIKKLKNKKIFKKIDILESITTKNLLLLI